MGEPEHADGVVPGVDQIETERLVAACDEAIQLVASHLPQHVYPSTETWRVTAVAWVARMTGTLSALRLLIDSGLRSEADTLLRSLWEHVVTYCWYMVDPERRLPRLRDHSLAGQRTLHQDAADYGLPVLSSDELAQTQGKKRLPKLIPLAAEVDEYWGGDSKSAPGGCPVARRT